MKLDKFPTLEDNFPLDYREDVVVPMFENIKKVESFSLIGMKDNARVNVMRFIASREDVQKRYLNGDSGKYMFVFVDLNELESFDLASFYSLVATCLPGCNATDLKSLKLQLSDLMEKSKKIIVFMFNNFDLARRLDLDLIYHQLISLRNVARYRLVYIFTGCRPFEPVTFFFQKIIFMKPFFGRDALSMIDRLCTRYDYNLSDKQKQEVINESGGHAGLVKFCVQNLAQGKKIKDSDEINFQCQRILASLDEIQMARLKTGQADELLIKMGFVVQKDEKIRIFSPLVEKYLIKEKHELKAFVFDQENNALYYFGQIINKLLTQRELKLIIYMLKEPTKIFSRGEIMEAIWRTNATPSDWAFDKFLSRLRKKLGVKDAQSILKTSRGSGVCLI